MRKSATLHFRYHRQDAIATAARMNISREHFPAAGGENLYWSRAMSRKISLLREVERGGGRRADENDEKSLAEEPT